MTGLTKGTVLTCAHEKCGCRVLVQEVCHCGGVTAESTYMCACGAPLVPVSSSVAAEAVGVGAAS